MTETLIITSYPGDEIIGNFSLLQKKETNPIIIYTGEHNQLKREQSLKLRDFFEIKAQYFLNSIPMQFMKPENIFYFPDPVYENDPEYRKQGQVGESMARSGLNIIFYLTSMNGPYIHTISDFEDKKRKYYDIYPDSGIYQYEKIFKYEGHCKWIF